MRGLKLLSQTAELEHKQSQTTTMLWTIYFLLPSGPNCLR
jgi:hypothetical protein